MEYAVADRCEFHSGDLVDGTYKVERSLGEGTFGTVYRVSTGKGDIYALKLLKLWTVPPEACRGLKARFTMEFETGQIDSPYLAHAYSYGEIKGNPYILMEFCPNGDLRGYVSSNSSVNYVRTGRQILLGLGDLHSHGKVHRDLKPENVLLRSDYTAVLTDFGISGDQNKRMTERGWLGKPSQIFGTYPYMPPEQVNPPKGGQATVLPTTDIFSFGVMMYEMLVGYLPFGELTEATLYRYLENGKKGVWDRKALKKADRSGVWADIVEGCLEPDFRSRIQSTAEIVRMLPSRGFADIHVQEMHRPYMPVIHGVLLRVMQGEEYGREYRLDQLCGQSHLLTVGRNTDITYNSVAISESMSSYISRHHCTLERAGTAGQWIIRDGQWVDDGVGHGYWKQSLNGTYVNSSEVDMYGMPINPGDIISLGDVKLRVEGY